VIIYIISLQSLNAVRTSRHSSSISKLTHVQWVCHWQ